MCGTGYRTSEQDARPVQLVEVLEDVDVLEEDPCRLVAEHSALDVLAVALERLDKFDVVSVARHDQGGVIRVLERQRQRLDRDGDVDTLLDERAVGAAVEPSE